MDYKTPRIKIETTQTLDAMLHQVLNQALVAIEAEAGSLMLVATKRGLLQIKARLGKPRPGRLREQVFKIGDNTIASWVVQNKRSYLCPDVDQDPHFSPSPSGRYFLSLLSVPVIHNDKVLAVINADAPVRDFFQRTHQEKLEFVARQVAEPIADRISVLDAMAEVGIELSRLPSEGGVEPVLERIAQLAVRSLGADVVTLYQYVQELDMFPVKGKGPTIYPTVKDPRFMRREIHPGDVPARVVKERRSGFYSDVSKEEFLTGDVERPGEEPRSRFVEREGIKSMAALLLPYRAAEMKEEEVVGVMFANYRTPHEFNIDEISALATFADYAAAAILTARREQQRREEQLKMAESISANFAHRMSNLAGTSRVAAQILEKRIDPSDEIARRQLERIQRESNVLLDLAQTIARAYGKTGRTFELLPVDVSHILREELDHLRPELGSISLNLEMSPNLPKVLSVEFQLRQVLHDALSNAVEAMAEQTDGQLAVRAGFDRKARRVQIEIQDNGPGIRDDIRSALFSPGVTSKKGKLGIGLWWCRTFMQATGGDLLLKESRPDKGTTFVVEIPWAEGAGVVPLEDLPSKDILIVDDSEFWRETLMDALPDGGYSIEQAEDYPEATRALQGSHFKLAILDVSLVGSKPDNKDGLRLLEDIDRTGLDTKVIYVTGHGTPEDEEIARRNPRLVGFMNKQNLMVGRFQDLVRQAVGQSAPLPGDEAGS